MPSALDPTNTVCGCVARRARDRTQENEALGRSARRPGGGDGIHDKVAKLVGDQ
jgi:hypothetical protein